MKPKRSVMQIKVRCKQECRGEERNSAKHEGKPQPRRCRSRRKFFTGFCCVFQILFFFFARHFFNLLRCIFNNGSSSRIRRRPRCSSCFLCKIYFHHTHTHTLSTGTHSFCKDFPRCLKLAYVENGGRPKEMHAGNSLLFSLAFSPTLSLPLNQPLSLFNSVCRNKKVKKTQSSAASTHKKKPEPLYIAGCGGVYVIYNTYTYVAFFLLSVHCAAFAFITPWRRRRATTPTPAATTTNTLMNLHE